MKLTRISDSSVEPVSSALVKAHLVDVNSSDDTLLAMYIRRARMALEVLSRSALCVGTDTQTWKAVFTYQEWLDAQDVDGTITLGYGPMSAVTSIIERRKSATTTTVSTDVYTTDPSTNRILLKDDQLWPDISGTHTDCLGFTITYTAVNTALPDWAADGVCRLCGYLFERRGDSEPDNIFAVAGQLVPDAISYDDY